MNIYYVYAYIGENNLPYYIGKGKNRRAYSTQHGAVPVPKDKSKIVFLETQLSEIGALALERRYIRWYGKTINSTGILMNKCDGGIHGPSRLGSKASEETLLKLRKPKSKEHSEIISKNKIARDIERGIERKHRELHMIIRIPGHDDITIKSVGEFDKFRETHGILLKSIKRLLSGKPKVKNPLKGMTIELISGSICNRLY